MGDGTVEELPLAGIRVLDLATVLAAPVAATMLGDFGCEVVKVEEPRRGDFVRGNRGGSGAGSRSLQWVQEGRNKKSVTLDLRTTEGQALVERLIPHFDVVVTNFRPTTMERWGLGPEAMASLNPRAVIACITGYGLTGPYRDRGAFDRIASAYSGLTYTSGYPDRPPVRSGYSVIDYMAAYLAAFSIVTALHHRDVSGGSGQIIDLALYEAGFRASEDALLDYGWSGSVRERTGNTNSQIVPANDFQGADGRWISIHAGTPTLFARLAWVMEAEHLLEDPRFTDAEGRIVNQEELYRLIGEWVGGRDVNAVSELLNEAGIPASTIMSIADIAADPHFQERSIVEVDDHDFGSLPMVAPLPRMSATPGSIRTLGPRLGEHNEEVFGGWLSLSDDEMSQLARKGVISSPADPTNSEAEVASNRERSSQELTRDGAR